MQIEISPQAEATLRLLMETGGTAQQVVEQALAEKMARQRADLAALEEGITDLQAGRLHDADEVHGEVRQRLGIPKA